MMRLWLTTVFSILVATASVAEAADTADVTDAVVVELFTSQGCSSCPPVDAYMAELAARDGVIALALHVDYWDYIGWADSFADRANSNRQRAYASVVGSRTLFTPQIIVQGRDRLIGNEREHVEQSIAQRSAEPASVDIDLERDGDTLSIRLASRGMGAEPCVVQLVRYRPSATVAIARGENAGRELDYHNIVTEWTRLARWDGAGNWSIDVPVEGDEPIAVIVQAEGYGPVLAAKRLR